MTLLFGVLALTASLSAGSMPMQSPAPARPFENLSYDEFSRLTRDSRQEIFQLMTPDKRAAIVSEHIHRWRARNDARLSAEQKLFLSQIDAWITPEQYAEALKNPERDAKLKALETTARQLFSPADLEDLLYMGTERDREQ